MSRKISQVSFLLGIPSDVVDADTYWYPPSRFQLWGIHPGASVIYTHDFYHLDPRESYSVIKYLLLYPWVCLKGPSGAFLHLVKTVEKLRRGPFQIFY